MALRPVLDCQATGCAAAYAPPPSRVPPPLRPRSEAEVDPAGRAGQGSEQLPPRRKARRELRTAREPGPAIRGAEAGGRRPEASAARPVDVWQQVGPRMGERGKGAAVRCRWNSCLKMSLRGQPRAASLAVVRPPPPGWDQGRGSSGRPDHGDGLFESARPASGPAVTERWAPAGRQVLWGRHCPPWGLRSPARALPEGLAFKRP